MSGPPPFWTESGSDRPSEGDSDCHVEGGPRSCRRVDGCITCSDEGTPMEVIEVDADRALAVCSDGSGARSRVMTDLVGPVAPGDHLLVHAGTALLFLDAGGPDSFSDAPRDASGDALRTPSGESP